MKRSTLWLGLLGILLFAGACQTTGTGTKSGNVWRTSANGVQVYMGGPPGGIKRVIGTIYADAHSETDAIEALTAEAARLRADAIYGVTESQELPGQARTPGSGGTGSPLDRGGKGSDPMGGDYSSERHIRTWRATAVVLEPAAPAERVEGDEESADEESADEESADETTTDED